MILAAHMLLGSWECSIGKIVEKNNNLVRFDVSLYTILGPPQISSFACYMRPHSGPILSFLAYYMGAPSDQFLRIEYGGPLRSVSSLIMEASLIMPVLFSYYIGAPRISFFACYIGAPSSLSSLTIWGPLSDQFLCLLYAPTPQISFFACYRGATQIIFFTKYMVTPQISFSAYYMGRAPLRLVSSITIWGPFR